MQVRRWSQGAGKEQETPAVSSAEARPITSASCRQWSVAGPGLCVGQRSPPKCETCDQSLISHTWSACALLNYGAAARSSRVGSIGARPPRSAPRSAGMAVDALADALGDPLGLGGP